MNEVMDSFQDVDKSARVSNMKEVDNKARTNNFDGTDDTEKRSNFNRGVTLNSEENDCCHEDSKRVRINKFLFILVIGFALGSWIDINAIFSQFGILTTQLPEDSELPSFLAVIVQCANVFPLFYVIGRKLRPDTFHEKPVIYIILSWGCIALLALAFCYNKVVTFSTTYSVGLPLLLLSFSLAAVDTLSTITFLPFMSLLPMEYLSPFFFGQSLSGLIPSLLSLAQGIDKVTKPCSEKFTYNSFYCMKEIKCNNTYTVYVGKYFSSMSFYLAIFGFMLLSLISFIIINNSKHIQNVFLFSYQHFYEEKLGKDSCLSVSAFKNKLFKEWKNLDTKFCIHLFSVAIVSFLANGVIVQTIYYVTSHYEVFHLCNNLYLASGALTSILLLRISVKSHKVTLAYSAILFLLCIVLITIAALAKNGILMNATLGKVLLISIYVVCGHIYNAVRQIVCAVSSVFGPDRMLLTTIFIQFGSFLGTFVIFFPITIGCVFS